MPDRRTVVILVVTGCDLPTSVLARSLRWTDTVSCTRRACTLGRSMHSLMVSLLRGSPDSRQRSGLGDWSEGG